jgi:hypothetical protein
MAITLWNINKIKEKLDEAIKDVSDSRTYIESMKRENIESWKQFHEIDVNPETVCKPLIMNNQVTDRITYTCNKNRNARSGFRRAINQNVEMIKIQEKKLIAKSGNVLGLQDSLSRAKMEFENLELQKKIEKEKAEKLEIEMQILHEAEVIKAKQIILDASSISSLSEEIIIQKQLENTPIPIKPEIIASSSLIPLGIIAILLLYTSRGKK